MQDECISRVTAVAGARNMYYLLHQGCCVSVANWVMSRASGRYLRIRAEQRDTAFFALLGKMIITSATDTLREIKSLPRSLFIYERVCRNYMYLLHTAFLISRDSQRLKIMDNVE